MHIKRDVSVWNVKTILNVSNRKNGFSGRSKRLLTISLLSATIQILTPTWAEDRCMRSSDQ